MTVEMDWSDAERRLPPEHQDWLLA